MAVDEVCVIGGAGRCSNSPCRGPSGIYLTEVEAQPGGRRADAGVRRGRVHARCGARPIPRGPDDDYAFTFRVLERAVKTRRPVGDDADLAELELYEPSTDRPALSRRGPVCHGRRLGRAGGDRRQGADHPRGSPTGRKEHCVRRGRRAVRTGLAIGPERQAALHLQQQRPLPVPRDAGRAPDPRSRPAQGPQGRDDPDCWTSSTGKAGDALRQPARASGSDRAQRPRLRQGRRRSGSPTMDTADAEGTQVSEASTGPRRMGREIVKVGAPCRRPTASAFHRTRPPPMSADTMTGRLFAFDVLGPRAGGPGHAVNGLSTGGWWPRWTGFPAVRQPGGGGGRARLRRHHHQRRDHGGGAFGRLRALRGARPRDHQHLLRRGGHARRLDHRLGHGHALQDALAAARAGS